MAITSTVNAKAPLKVDPNPIENISYTIYFGVFFDGTNNNMVQANVARDIRKKYTNKYARINNIKLSEIDRTQDISQDITLPQIETEIVKNDTKYQKHKYSNIAILHSFYQGINNETNDDKTAVYKIYVEGSGANDINGLNGKPLVGLGFGLGKTGVVALVSKAVRAIMIILSAYSKEQRKKINLKFDVFGFSRGAACARLFSYLIARANGDTLPNGRETEFGKFYAKPYFEGSRLKFIDKTEWNHVSIDFLGIFDTVVSIGFLRRKVKDEAGHEEDDVNALHYLFAKNQDFDKNFHDQNVEEYGMYSPQMKETVKHCFHIGAMDEFRENFAFTDIGKEVEEQSLEILLPGCHSDIGGGYINEDPSVMNFHNYKSLRYYTSNPQNKSTSEIEKLSADLMVKLGWGKKDEVKETMTGALQFHRKVPACYCSLPLRVMIERIKEAVTENKRGESMFRIDDNIYAVPSGLNDFKKAIVDTIKGQYKKRMCIFPKGGYSGEAYKTLRLNYLHFTSSDTIGVQLVNGANKFEHEENNIVCRIVYHGDKKNDSQKENDSQMHFMSDYSISAIELTDINPPEQTSK